MPTFFRSNKSRPQGLRDIQNGGTEKIMEHATKILHESWSILSRDTFEFCLRYTFSVKKKVETAIFDPVK